MAPASAFSHPLALAIAICKMAVVGCCQASPSTNAEAGFSTINVESNPHRALSLGLVVTDHCFTPSELDHMVRRHIGSLRSQFDLGQATARVFVPRITNYLAAVWYSPGKGQPAVLCMLDFDGKVISTRFAQAALEGAGLPAVVLRADMPTATHGIPDPTDKLWTPERVDSVVKAFVADRKLAFDFSGVRSSGLSVPRNRLYLAHVWYRHEWGKPALSCKVGLDGQVFEHHVGVARPD
jgi:hypothetical protein